jgi:seryl-tRNA synthetase
MSDRTELQRLSKEKAKLRSEIEQANADTARATEIIADAGQEQAAAIIANETYIPPILPDVAALDALIARNRSALGQIDDKIAELQRTIEAENRAIKAQEEAKRSNFIQQYREEGSHLFKFEKIEHLTIREVLAILATQQTMPGDPRVAVHVSLGRIPDADWLKCKENARELINA